MVGDKEVKTKRTMTHEEMWPESVGKEDYLRLRAGELLPVAWVELQALRKRVAALETV